MPAWRGAESSRRFSDRSSCPQPPGCVQQPPPSQVSPKRQARQGRRAQRVLESTQASLGRSSCRRRQRCVLQESAGRGALQTGLSLPCAYRTMRSRVVYGSTMTSRLFAEAQLPTSAVSSSTCRGIFGQSMQFQTTYCERPCSRRCSRTLSRSSTGTSAQVVS